MPPRDRDRDADPDAAAGAGPASSEAILERGQTIDRFVVVALVGRGGMGEVYSAYDPELDRKVALKLVRARQSGRANAGDAHTRLLREAQAIAKLSDPNVVVVYDVGTVGDKIFIAMEFVEGNTVGFWLHAQPRSWREVLKVFLAAGRGLVAAHEAGIVHRDFKPDNVMVAKDGQIRVMDFGLARQITGAPLVTSGGAPAPKVQPDNGDGTTTLDPAFDPEATTVLGNKHRPLLTSSSERYLSLKLTQTGAQLGTPAYMAPEQFAAQAGDARTDQFSFCASLYEGLYGERPFAGESFLSLMTNVTTGAVSDPPPKTRVPGWIRRVLLRGLQTDPTRRFPSMKALLAALETDPTVRARRAVAGFATLAVLATAVVGARSIAGSHQALCRGGGERLAGIWEPNQSASARKRTIERAFLATGKSFAAQAFTGATHLLNEYTGRWLGMYRDACEATHVRGEQSTEVLDLRMSCLQERLTAVRALTDVLARADGPIVENAIGATGALPQLDRCADVALLKAVVKPPPDESTRQQVEVLRGERARMVALREGGHCAEAERLATTLIPKVRALGYQPLLADALIAAAALSNECIDTSRGIQRYREAFAAALVAHDDQVAAQAATLLGSALGDRGGQSEAGREWLGIGRALIARIGGDPLLEAWVMVGEGGILVREGNGNAAVSMFEQSRAAKEKLLGKDHPDVLGSLFCLGNALAVAHRYEEALVADVSTSDAQARLLGPDHPQVAMTLSNEGEALNALHRYPEARVALQRALDIWQQSGADPFFLSYGFTGLGFAYLGEGRPADAVAPLEAALRIRTAEPVEPARLGEVRFALARALWQRPSQRSRALALAGLARTDYGRVKGNGSIATMAAIDGWLRAPSARL